VLVGILEGARAPCYDRLAATERVLAAIGILEGARAPCYAGRVDSRMVGILEGARAPCYNESVFDFETYCVIIGILEGARAPCYNGLYRVDVQDGRGQLEFSKGQEPLATDLKEESLDAALEIGIHEGARAPCYKIDPLLLGALREILEFTKGQEPLATHRKRPRGRRTIPDWNSRRGKSPLLQAVLDDGRQFGIGIHEGARAPCYYMHLGAGGVLEFTKGQEPLATSGPFRRRDAPV
jgi:hypothetical protein